jgi:hypothetical protein
MLKMDVIEPSNSPYSFPVVIVPKADKSMRVCVDYRKLNQITVFDAEPMPNMEEVFIDISGYRYISKIDLTKGYWQIALTDDAKPLTAFQTPNGLFQWKVVPFGLVNSGATFCRLMRKVLNGLKSVASFVDDVWVYTNTWADHLNALRSFLIRLRQAKLTAKPSKCFIGMDKIDSLGHTVSKNALEPNKDKIQSIVEATRPTTKRQVRSFLGLVGFYRKFIPNFSTIAAPLTDLTKKNKPNSNILWESAHDIAFQTLKDRLTKYPILRIPNFKDQFILRTDASDQGIAGVLLQESDDGKFPVAYASRKLLDREKSFSVIEKECLGIVWGIEKFHRYLFGVEFVLETDHKPLVYLQTAKTLNPRLMRWALKLQPYRFRVESIRGRDNIGADYLSRY